MRQCSPQERGSQVEAGERRLIEDEVTQPRAVLPQSGPALGIGRQVFGVVNGELAKETGSEGH